MAATRLLNLFAISALAVLLCSFNAIPVTAISDPHHMLRARGHSAILAAKRKRGNGKRCKPRTTLASSSPSPTPAEQSNDPPAPPPVVAAEQAPPNPSPSTTSTSQVQVPSPAVAPAQIAPANVNPGGGKVGLAWPNGDSTDIVNFISSHTNYCYTWSPYKCPDSRLTSMPMLWNTAWDKISDWTRLTGQADYAKVYMGFNEINEPGQANMSPEQAAAAWQQYIQPLKRDDVTLVSPSTSSNPNGLPMIQKFLEFCQGCTVDVMSLHYYDITCDGLIAYVELWHQTFNRDVMITEFACQNFNGGPQCSESQVWDFYGKCIPWLESTPYVRSYMVFGAMHDMSGVNPLNQLMNPAGGLTALGNSIINVSL